MREDQGGIAGKRAEHVDRFAVGQVVKARRTSRFDAAAQRLAVKGDRAQHFRRATHVQIAGMAAESSFQLAAVERQEEMT